MTALDLVQSLLVAVVCGVVYSTFVAKWAPEEKRVALYCWVAHLASALAIVAVYTYFYRSGDLLVYFERGRGLGRYVEYDVTAHLPQVLDLLLQREHSIPAQIPGSGTSTGSMIAVGGLVALITTSNWAGSILIASLSALGQAVLWLGFREIVPAERRNTALWAVFLAPSAVFWSSSLLKEVFALLGVGLIIRGGARVRTGALGYVAHVAAGALAIGLFKAYVLFPLAAALGVYGYWSQAASKGGVKLSPVALVSGAVATLAMVVALGEIFPTYAIDSLVGSIETQQAASLTVEGGSDFRDASEERGPRGPLGLAVDLPFTLLTALFRPVLFESRNVMMLVNSLETTLLLFLFVTSLYRVGPRKLVGWVWRSPDLMACVVFVVLFSLAVGLATTNLGTLSRYRLPMMPFYFYVLFAARSMSLGSAKIRSDGPQPARSGFGVAGASGPR